tara:strand:- start:641 stop:979 length:339 start_codon:yes stop_codon:yes gene_type:complete
MFVIFKHFGVLGIFAIIHFPIMYIFHLLRFIMRGIWLSSKYGYNKSYFRTRDNEYDFVMGAHNKIGFGVFIMWLMILSNAEDGEIAFEVCKFIYIICVVLSWIPFHLIANER